MHVYTLHVTVSAVRHVGYVIKYAQSQSSEWSHGSMTDDSVYQSLSQFASQVVERKGHCQLTGGEYGSTIFEHSIIGAVRHISG